MRRREEGERKARRVGKRETRTIIRNTFDRAQTSFHTTI